MHRGFVSGTAVKLGSDDAFAVSNTYRTAGQDFRVVTVFQLHDGAPSDSYRDRYSIRLTKGDADHIRYRAFDPDVRQAA